jgi:hypothetical protein
MARDGRVHHRTRDLGDKAACFRLDAGKVVEEEKERSVLRGIRQETADRGHRLGR